MLWAARRRAAGHGRIGMPKAEAGRHVRRFHPGQRDFRFVVGDVG